VAYNLYKYNMEESIPAWIAVFVLAVHWHLLPPNTSTQFLCSLLIEHKLVETQMTVLQIYRGKMLKHLTKIKAAAYIRSHFYTYIVSHQPLSVLHVNSIELAVKALKFCLVFQRKEIIW